MNSPPYYFRRAFVLPLPGREEACCVYMLDSTERDREVLNAWKGLSGKNCVERHFEQEKEMNVFLQRCIQGIKGESLLRDAYEEQERFHPGIPSEDLNSYSHCQVCHAGQYHEDACYGTRFKRCYGCGKKCMDVFINRRNWRRPVSLCDDCSHHKYGVGFSMQTWLAIQRDHTEANQQSIKKGARKDE